VNTNQRLPAPQVKPFRFVPAKGPPPPFNRLSSLLTVVLQIFLLDSFRAPLIAISVDVKVMLGDAPSSFHLLIAPVFLTCPPAPPFSSQVEARNRNWLFKRQTMTLSLVNWCITAGLYGSRWISLFPRQPPSFLGVSLHFLLLRSLCSLAPGECRASAL